MSTALVIGRFLPPHAGHQLLVRTAQALAAPVTIILRVRPDDPIASALRQSWLATLFPDAEVMTLEEPAAGLSPHEIAERIGAKLADEIGCVFSGDAGESAIAAALGARCVQLDPEQRTIPIGGADIRADPFAAWTFLPPPVRPHYAKTICLHGPESTGKSTLAPALARAFETIYLPEYGRTYCQEFGLALTMADLLAIGRTHAAMTRAALELCNKRLILDTDPLMTAAWAEMLFERSHPWFDAFTDTADLYLLLDADVPWINDGTRFFGDEDRRRRFLDCSRRQLDKRGLAYAVIGGPVEERFDRAMEAIKAAGLG